MLNLSSIYSWFDSTVTPLVKDFDLISFGSLIASFVGVWIAYLALRIARDQLIPIRDQIEKLTFERKLTHQINKIRSKQKQPRELVGYDPRFSNLDWNLIISPPSRQAANIKMSLSQDYKSFHSSFEANCLSATLRSGG